MDVSAWSLSGRVHLSIWPVSSPALPCRVAILGSTGSIGTQTLDVIDALNRDAGERMFEVVALSAHRQAEALLKQARQLRPRLVALTDDTAAGEFAPALRETGARVMCGQAALTEIAAYDEVDAVVHAVVGAAGLRAAFAAARAGKRICLANKESLVVGGPLLMQAVREGGASVLPVDSEHSAVFQAMSCGRREEIDRVLLTASGGPFRDPQKWPMERLGDATVEDALAHPTWDMGGKITVDSATMFNKALEIIEAVHLFDLQAEQVAVVVHPQSIVHSMVEYRDGSVLAQLSPPDMRTPIGYALTYPHRGRPGGKRMRWDQAQSLTFEPPDEERFPALRLAFEALAAGPVAPVILNAANEIAVGRFLERKVPLSRIADTVEQALSQMTGGKRLEPASSLDDLLEVDAEARRRAEEIIIR